jgi:hypothetical protein
MTCRGVASCPLVLGVVKSVPADFIPGQDVSREGGSADSGDLDNHELPSLPVNVTLTAITAKPEGIDR